jgi:hypothetical protein
VNVCCGEDTHNARQFNARTGRVRDCTVGSEIRYAQLLLREVHAAEEGVEADVGAEGVES